MACFAQNSKGMWTRRASILTACIFVAIAISAVGCYDENRNRAEGSATITWTLQGRTDPMVCSQFGASEVEIRVVDATGKVASDLTSPCPSFRAAVSLGAGEYVADLMLLDDTGRPVSDVARTKTFRIGEQTRIAAAARFPGCPTVFVPIPKCPNGKPVELRNAIGCLSGYDCAELSN